MNVFFLDRDPSVAAAYHCNKHVVKMILESAQILSTAHRVLDGQLSISISPKSKRKSKTWFLPDWRDPILYKATHVNHPSVVWTRSNIDHYRWLYDLFYHLIGEYKYRYNNKHHLCEKLLLPLLDAPNNIPICDWVDPPQAMPEDVKVPNSSIEAYRRYYIVHKNKIATWKIRDIPPWFFSTGL